MNTFARMAALSLVLASGPALGFTPVAEGGESRGEVVLPALDPAAAALRDALVAGGEQTAAMLQAYQAHDFQPIWEGARLDAFLGALDVAGRHGLAPARYGAEGLSRLAASGAPQHEREIAISQAFLLYARDVNSGMLEPRSVDRDIVIRPHRPDQVALLEGLIETPDPAGYLAALAPSHPDYAALMEEKSRLEALIAAGGWGEKVPEGPTIRVGDTGNRVVALRARLGRLDGRDYGTSPAFDSALEEAVKAFQLRHGLNDDGVVGPMTLESVNASAETRLGQVLVNLERQRWLNFDRGSRHIYVNQADFSVRLIDNGSTTLYSRAVIGQNQHRTQEFNDEMTHLVVNPTWHVPRSIATEEMLPQLQRNPGALGPTMQIMTTSGLRVNPQLVDFTQFNRSNFPFIVKQSPGDANALGKVKFMFPNQFNIYLHDTPSKNLFSRDVRAFSHGCVRVQKPFELAHELLSRQAADPVAYFDSLLATGRERRVDLERPVPVYLTYQSAWIDEAGVPQYRADVYGRDASVLNALIETGVTLGAVEG